MTSSFVNSFDTGIKTAKYSASIGSVIMLVLFIKLIHLYLQENRSSHNVNPAHKNHICLYTNAFLVVASSVLTTVGYFIYHCQFIELSNTICQIIVPITAIFYSLTRSFFYNFMLYRVKSISETQSTLRVNIIWYYILIIFGNSTLLTLLIFAFLAFDFQWDTTYNICVTVLNTTASGNPLLIISLAAFGDMIVTFIILVMFLSRLCKMKTQSNDNNNGDINKWIFRQIIIGILCTVTSLISAVTVSLTSTKIYISYACITWDIIINAICIVVTFDFNCVRWCNDNPYNPGAINPDVSTINLAISSNTGTATGTGTTNEQQYNIEMQALNSSTSILHPSLPQSGGCNDEENI